jgi:hypothetical protein
MFIFEKVGHSKFVEMHGNTSDFFQSAFFEVVGKINRGER